jgi:hypothetical protein
LRTFFKEEIMSDQPRAAKVLAALLVSMTTGAIILMALGNNPPSAGPFCLSSYYHLDSVEKAISSSTVQSADRWNCIEIYYSGTMAGNIEQLASLSGLASPEDINCHFVVCNGCGAGDGQILPTEKWRRQWSVVPDPAWNDSGHTIRLCVIADGKNAPPSDLQLKRVDTLVGALHRKFDIQPQFIYYPNDW